MRAFKQLSEILEIVKAIFEMQKEIARTQADHETRIQALEARIAEIEGAHRA